MRKRRPLILTSLLLVLAISPLRAVQVPLPAKQDSLRFAVIGDTGTGERREYEVASQVALSNTRLPLKIVLMLGDNLYGGESPRDFDRKFAVPYKLLIAAGVKFYATLGNHDDPNQRFYANFNMNGQRYYTFKPKAGIHFFALDSNYLDRAQLQWLEKELRDSDSDWKIAFFHHPLYSSGKRHGSDVELRKALEPLFVKYGVSVVFSGHDHFYERIKPQKGIHYFVEGGSAKLREGNIGYTNLTARGFDTDNSFMLVEIAGDELYFQAISRTGRTVDSGVIRRNESRKTE